jgi:hypothetical protein
LPIMDRKRESFVVMGIDTSLSSIALAAKAWDGPLKKMRGPVTYIRRFSDSPYHEKLIFCAKGHDVILDALHKLHGFVHEISDIYVAVEEPWPMGRNIKANSAFLLQQAQMQGALLSSLMKYGFDTRQVGVKKWRTVVAGDLDVKQNAEFDKWTVKAWAREVYPQLPRYKDLIYKNGVGLIPKPKESKAQAKQPDDRYDALGIMEWLYDEVIEERKKQRELEEENRMRKASQ